MSTEQFDYHRPDTLDEAIQMLTSIEGARAIAGGQSLLPVMKFRLAAPAALVDLSRIPGLSGIERSNGSVVIGAMTTHADVAASDVIAGNCPVLGSAAGMIGDPQVRNRGTIGGSAAHADPSADYPTVLTALGAEINVKGPNGERTIAAADFFVDIFTSSLQPGELVTSVTVPVLDNGRAGAYIKHRHPASSYAVVGACAVLSVSDGTMSDASLAIGGATAKAVSVPDAAAAVNGKAPGDDAYREAASHVAGAITNPLGDVYASGEFRVHLAGVLTMRALSEAAGTQ